MKSTKRFYLLGFLALALVTLGAGCQKQVPTTSQAVPAPNSNVEVEEMVVNDSVPAEVEEEEVKTVEPETTSAVIDLDAIVVADPVATLGSFIMSENAGAQTTVYSVDAATGLQSVLLQFDEVREYETGSGNLYAGQPAAVDYSADRNELAYVSDASVSLYDLGTNTSAFLVEKTGTTGEQIDSIDFPTWSRSEISEGALSLSMPVYSNDGSVLSFTEGFYEGSNPLFYNFADDTLTAIEIFGWHTSGIDWSPDSSHLVYGDGLGYAPGGLFVTDISDLVVGESIVDYDPETKQIEFGPRFLDNDTVAFVYTPSHNQPHPEIKSGLNIEDPSVLATVGTDGANEIILIQNEWDHQLLAADKNTIIYEEYLKAGQGLHNGVWVYDLSTTTATKIFDTDPSEWYRVDSLDTAAQQAVFRQFIKGADDRVTETLVIVDLATNTTVFKTTPKEANIAYSFLGWK